MAAQQKKQQFNVCAVDESCNLADKEAELAPSGPFSPLFHLFHITVDLLTAMTQFIFGEFSYILLYTSFHEWNNNSRPIFPWRNLMTPFQGAQLKTIWLTKGLLKEESGEDAAEVWRLPLCVRYGEKYQNNTGKLT